MFPPPILANFKVLQHKNQMFNFSMSPTVLTAGPRVDTNLYIPVINACCVEE